MSHSAKEKRGSSTSQRAERWTTPLTALSNVTLESLTDQGGNLVLRFSGRGAAGEERWLFRFTLYPLYVTTAEECCLRLTRIGETHALGATVVLEGSQLLGSLQASEPLAAVHHPGLRHYAFLATDEVVEVLSSVAPQIMREGS